MQRDVSVPPAVFALSIHADYRCRHSGKCCSVDWDVPIELPVYRSLERAVAAGRLQMAPHGEPLAPFVTGPALPDDAGAIFERTSAGACVFLERGANLCVVHRDLGESALPATCRHFPRVTIRDARGTSVALSHFCPTAASMLFREDVPLAIVSAPPAFPSRDYDGLTVEPDDLPPLLHPHMLMDLEAYSAWEAHMVERCRDLARVPESVLATLARDAAQLRAWRPGGAPLIEAVASLPRDPVPAAPHDTLAASLALHAGAMRAVPPEFLPEPDLYGLEAAFEDYVRPRWASWHAPLNRYIAAKAFATWTAYQGQGVATIVRGIEAAVALVRVEAARACRDAGRALDRALLLESFRGADFILNHLATGDELARGWSVVERESAA